MVQAEPACRTVDRGTDKDSIATKVSAPVDWSYAAVNEVAEPPATSPSYCLSLVATPTGTAVSITGKPVARVAMLP